MSQDNNKTPAARSENNTAGLNPSVNGNPNSNTNTNTTTQVETTTTTTEKVDVQERPTGDRASVNYPGGDASPAAERQGEVTADKSADTKVLGGDHGSPTDDAKASAENIENAKQEALRNANDEQKQQPSRDSSRGSDRGGSDRNSSNRDTDRE